ncbi:MAG: endonuclease domain-containing protein [Hyphomonadaceae bacterium]
MNSGEDRAWQTLRRLREFGIHVVRQHEIGRYTVDFAIRRSRIAIEIDGGVHDFPGRADYDAQRQAHIESKGWKVVRIRTESTCDPKNIIDAVRAVLPLPLRGGGGGQGEPWANEGLRAQTADDYASPHPLTPSSQEEGEIPAHIRRRTRVSRRLAPRRKS